MAIITTATATAVLEENNNGGDTNNKKLSIMNTTMLCGIVLSFKSILVLIYGVVYKVIKKLSEKSSDKAHRVVVTVTGENNNSTMLADPRQVKGIKDIPGPRPLPFFGTLLTSKALKSDNLMKVNEEREELYGPLVKEEHFWNFPLIMVLGTEEMKQIIRTSPLYRPGMEILMVYRNLNPDRYNCQGLVSSQGATWKHLHNTFSSVTTNMKFVRSLHSVFQDVVSDTVNSVPGDGSATRQLPTLINKLITETSFYIAFGKRFGFVGTETEIPEEVKLFTNCHEAYWKAFHKSMYGFPWWKYYSTKVWKDFTAAEDKMIAMVDEIASELLETGTAGGVLAAVKKDQITRSDLNVVLLELVLGATEPVYHALILTLYWISKYDHVYNRVLEELKEQLPSKDSPVDEEVLLNIPYLKACVLETFRICPTTCNVARVLENEMVVGGYRLPKYTAVILQTWHACLQDSNFYRAKEFIPERWLFEDGVPPFRPHDRSVVCNFGVGQRACPGRKIAQQLINTFLCKLLRRYKVKFVKDIELSYEWLLVAKDPIIVEFHEHEN